MKNWLLAAALLALGFAAGILSSSNILGFGRLLQGSVSVRCVDNRACVGDGLQVFLTHYDDDKGGLTGVICVPTEADREAQRMIEDLSLADIVQGRTCPANYLLEFRNPSTRTLVSIENGIVTDIEQGPLHIIDF